MNLFTKLCENTLSSLTRFVIYTETVFVNYAT